MQKAVKKTHKAKGNPYKVPRSLTFKAGPKNSHLTHGSGSKKTK